MLAIHELGEIVIRGLTQFQILRDKKEKSKHQAVHKILSKLIDGKQFKRKIKLRTFAVKSKCSKNFRKGRKEKNEKRICDNRNNNFNNYNRGNSNGLYKIKAKNK